MVRRSQARRPEAFVLSDCHFRFGADTGKVLAGSVVSTAPMLVTFRLRRRRVIGNMALINM